MPEFILDSSGRVPIAGADHIMGAALSFDNPDEFTRGYIEALFFTESGTTSLVEWDGSDASTIDGSLPGDAGFSDLYPETLAKIIRDCAAFQTANAADLESIYDLPPGRYSRRGDPIDARRAGQFFWYARNGHGVAWDDDFSPDDDGADILDRLQEASEDCGQVWASFGAAASGAESPTGYGFVFVE